MAFHFTPKKRPHERGLFEPNGRRKFQKSSASSVVLGQQKTLPGAIAFRLLCPSSKTGSVIGKGGGIVAKIRHETGAKIKIEETVHGCEERVVVIIGSEKDGGATMEKNKEEEDGGNIDGGGEDIKVADEDNKEKGNSSTAERSKSEKRMSSAQKALMLVFERVIESERENDGRQEGRKGTPSVSARLLIFSSQIGCIYGVGGSIIKEMCSSSGAKINVLQKDKLPLCASEQDGVVEISGSHESVRKALQLASQQLLENPPRERDTLPANNSIGSSSNTFSSFPQPEFPRQEFPGPEFPRQEFHGPQFPRPEFPRPEFPRPEFPRPEFPRPEFPRPEFPGSEAFPFPGRFRAPAEKITFRLLCSNDKVGSVIGKGGSIIKAIQNDTFTEIKVNKSIPESDDHVIAITGPVLPDDGVSPAQIAVCRVQERIVLAMSDKPESTVVLKLIVASNHTNCLVGKGGVIINEMRKLSGAQIRILGRDLIPTFISDNDEIVQVSGEPGAVHNALVQITTHLKFHVFRERIPTMSPIPHSGFSDQIPPLGPFSGRREPSPGRYYESARHAFDERPAFPSHTPGGPPRSVERIPPAPWSHQDIRESAGPLTFPDYLGGPAPQKRIGAFPEGMQPTAISNTTVDVVVPRALVPTIYGEDGFCLKKIREISEARITITEPRPEATETVIVISGTPEQTHAAQSLIQAFVMCGSGSP